MLQCWRTDGFWYYTIMPAQFIGSFMQQSNLSSRRNLIATGALSLIIAAPGFVACPDQQGKGKHGRREGRRGEGGPVLYLPQREWHSKNARHAQLRRAKPDLPREGAERLQNRRAQA
jgi:hypothetical protein